MKKKITYPNGDRYEGVWRENYPHGQGVLRQKDGTETRGTGNHDAFVE